MIVDGRRHSKTLAAIALLLTISATNAFAEDDDLCRQLAEFRNAPFEKDAQGKPLRRSVEYHWLGYWLDFENGWQAECRPGSSVAGKNFCDHLKASFEFPHYLPMRILSCSGWKIPQTYRLEFERVGIQILTDSAGKSIEDDRYLVLETDMRPHEPGQDLAIRLSAVPWDEKFLSPEPRLEVTYSDKPIVPTK